VSRLGHLFGEAKDFLFFFLVLTDEETSLETALETTTKNIPYFIAR
jgi:hypothetical protein